MTPTELIAAAREGIAKFNGAPNHVVEGLIAALEAQMWRPIDENTPRDTEVLVFFVGPTVCRRIHRWRRRTVVVRR